MLGGDAASVARVSVAIPGTPWRTPAYRGTCHRARVRATRSLIRATISNSALRAASASFLRTTGQKPAARKQRFDQPFQGDLGRPVSFSKIFRFSSHPNQWLFPCCLVPARGAYRDRHERGMGCGGRSSVRRADGVAGQVYPVSEIRRAGRTALTRTAKPCGPDTRGWCQAVGGEFGPTGSIEPSSRQRWRQDEFVSRESAA
jgi:hypothetical protein